jgi:hypothetical protein
VSNSVFPSLPGLALAFARESLYKTVTYENPGGTEQRVSLQATPRYRYTLRYNFLRQAVAAPSPYQAQTEVGVVLLFLDDHKGAWDSFLFDDPVDAIQRRVRFVEDSLRIERILGQVYEVSFELLTVTA